MIADYGVSVVESVRADTPRCDRGGGTAGVPGRCEDRSTRGAAQVRRRRGAPRGGRLALARGRVHGPRTTARSRVTVSKMAPPGVEIALGIVRDPQFGPLVLVGAGGVLVEILKDRRLAMPPLEELRARKLVDRLQIRPLLDGVQGQQGADVGVLARGRGRVVARTISANTSRRSTRTR